MTYNVRSLRDDKRAVAAVVRACRPDVVCVQEAPRFLRWRSKRAALAREAGLVVLGGERPAGLMVMGAFRVKPLSTEHRLLTRTPRLHQRGLAIAVVDVGGERYTVASMHLGLRGDERRRHVDEILAAVRSYDAPLVLAGDVNEAPGSPAYQALATELTDACPDAGPTFGDRRIDAVFVDPRLEVVSCQVPDVREVVRASDHRPLVVDVR